MMNKLISLILLVTLIPQIGYSEVKAITKGQAAPYDGYVITPDAEKALRLIDKDLETCQAVVAGQKRLDELNQANEAILSKRIHNYQEENSKLAEQLAKRESENLLLNVGHFVLGAALTGFITFGIVKITR